MSPEKLSPGEMQRRARDADFVARFGNGSKPRPVVPKADPSAAARQRAESIRDGLRSWVATRTLITEAYKGEDWIALGYTSWESYCDREFDMKSLRLTAEERNAAILSFRSVGMTTREIGAATGTSKDTVSRTLRAPLVSDETKPALVEALRGEIEAAAERTETSAGGPADPPESAAEVDASEGASADGAEVDATTSGHAFRPASAPAGTSEVLSSPLAGPGNPQDTPAAGTALPGEDTSYPVVSEPQQPGQDSPTGVEGPRSETSSLGWGSADVSQAWATSAGSSSDYATDHQHLPAGEAPGGGPVEPEELEDDGTAPRSSSSSDLDVTGNPAERLIFAVAGLVHYLDQLDVDAVGPLLDGPDVEQLFEHAEAISAHIERIGKARFAAMLHP